MKGFAGVMRRGRYLNARQGTTRHASHGNQRAYAHGRQRSIRLSSFRFVRLFAPRYVTAPHRLNDQLRGQQALPFRLEGQRHNLDEIQGQVVG